jgi:hypothetical protein
MPRMQLGMKKMIEVTMRMRNMSDTGKEYPAIRLVRGGMERDAMPEKNKSNPRVFFEG